MCCVLYFVVYMRGGLARWGHLQREKLKENGHTDISTDARQNMPPAM